MIISYNDCSIMWNQSLQLCLAYVMVIIITHKVDLMTKRFWIDAFALTSCHRFCPFDQLNNLNVLLKMEVTKIHVN